MDRGSLSLIFILAAMAIAISGMIAPENHPGVSSLEGTHKVASLAPCITATLRELGAEDSIALISDYCPDQPGVSRGGTALAPDLERIVRSGARVLLVRSATALPRGELRRVGIPIELPWSTVSEVADSIETIGALVDRPQAARELAGRIRDTLSGTAAVESPRVLLVIGESFDSSGGLWVIKPNSIHGAVLEAAGYRNALDQPLSGTPQLSIERLHQLDPDFIVHLIPGEESEGPSSAEILEDYATLDQLKAVKNSRVGRVCHPRILDEGPELLDLVIAIRQQLEQLDRGESR